MKEHRVEAVERALSIIECFTIDRQELTLTQLSQETGLYMSTILRLCGSLERYGYIVRNGSGEFRIGPSLWRLGSLYSRGFERAEIIRPHLVELVATIKETATFYVRDGNDRVCLFREVSPHALRFDIDEGSRLPMDRGAAAHVLRAYSKPLPDSDHEVRKIGHVVSISERTPGVSALAVPVFDRFGNLRGALGLSGPSFRFDENARSEALAALLDHSKQLKL